MTYRRPLAYAGGVLLALTAAWVPATAASAHAVLLNADPAAQTTLSSPPPVVRLQFSEPVETQFGSIRVVDNDGHDVTNGKLARASAGRDITVPIRPHTGTNFVIWQVVSSDGHVERGNYEFFLGAPSKTPARLTPGQQVASPAAGWTYGAFRFGWFAGLFGLIGLAVVWQFVWRPAADAMEDGDAGAIADRQGRRRFRWALASAWLVLAISGIGVLVGQAAADAGRSLGWAAHASSVNQVLHTTAGHYWRDALVLGGVLVAPVVVAIAMASAPGRGGRRASGAAIGGILAVTAGVALATALEGHARTVGHSTTGVPALTIHLLAVGVWVGGLGALLLLVTAGWRDSDPVRRNRFAGHLVRRFSRLAIGAVAAVIITGLIGAILDLNSPSDLVNQPYGRMLLIKLVLLQLALVFGARHLWFGPAASADAGGDPVETFPRSALAELGVLGLALVAASSLMVMVPGRAVAQASIAQLDLQQQAGAATVNVTVTPNQPGEDQIYVLFRDQRGNPLGSIKEPSAVLSGIGMPEQPVPLVWIANGRFTGSIDLPTATHYGLFVTSGQNDTAATFSFKVARLTSSTS